ncbi:MAG: DinB family protein [Anaerolineae bacterium]|nr:DinB family protein [Anaerolineae bacterium]
MNADMFRDWYAYHFTINRKIWEHCIIPLTDEQFTRKLDYSVGSIRNQVVHLLNVDDRWFSGLRGEPVPGFINPVHFYQRSIIRQKWDDVEARMQAYLGSLRDDQLLDQPFLPIDHDPVRVYQALLHVVNHGTDHRAQMLAALNQMGLTTFPQDYAYYFEGRM